MRHLSWLVRGLAVLGYPARYVASAAGLRLAPPYEVAVSGLGPYTLPHVPDGALMLVALDGGLLSTASFSLSGADLTLVGVTASNFQRLLIIYTY